jgi:beta-glucosidase
MRITYLISMVLILTLGCTSKSKLPDFKNPDLPLETRVNDLLRRMTLEQKISQMVNRAAAIDSLGIQQYNWWNECLHGVARAGLATVFPQPIGLAAMFDDGAVYRMADIISTEARAKHHDFVRKGQHEIYQGLTFWSPNINIFRDPRWGRGMETYGEDPYLTARNGVAFVKGLQGNDPNYFKVIATAKHYAVHSGPEPLRHSFDARIDERDFRETYVFAFEALIKEGKAYSVMCAYNRYLGEACCGSNRLLTYILRNEWGFKGYVVSDCGAISDIWTGHKLVKSPEEGVALAVRSGTDLECGDSYTNLNKAVALGLITEAEIDTAVRRLMVARFKLGMFDPEERDPYTKIPYSVVDCYEHKAIALETALKSIVLLKNENNVLPLSKNLNNILICGPNANNKEILHGNYNGLPSSTVTPLEGILSKAGTTLKVNYEKGCSWVDNQVTDQIPAEFLQIDGKNGFKVEFFANMNLEGTPLLTQYETRLAHRTEGGDFIPGVSSRNFSARWTTEVTAPETGEYTFSLKGGDGFRLLIDNNILIDGWKDHPNIPVIRNIRLEKGKKYPLRVDMFNEDWGAEIALEWKTPGKSSPEKALELAKSADVIIMFAGITPSLEGEEMPLKIEGFEGGDRTMLMLPKVQTEFLKKLKATGKPVVLVLLNGSALAINWEKENLPAILEAWYPGQAAGTAIADVLFGDYNPAGRLPVTFYKSEKDLPPFDEYSMKERTYRYFTGEPLFTFGYGLSYTSFEYSGLKSPVSITAGDSAIISVDVKNTGDKDGDEVIQLYLTHRNTDVPVPVRSLADFKRIFLKTGETMKVTFKISPQQLSILDNNLQRVVRSGIIDFSVGGKQPGKIPEKNVVTGTMEIKGDKVLLP